MKKISGSRWTYVLVAGFVLVFLGLLGLSGMRSPGEDPAWDSTAKEAWPRPFEPVAIPLTGRLPQRAMYLAPQSGAPRPLLVSLHTWSGDYSQADPLAGLALSRGWAYIHPDFQGPAKHPGACLSELVIEDLDAAVEFAIQRGGVDPEKIIVIGVSGGGYTATGYALRSKRDLLSVQAWVPISDLEKWHEESQQRGSQYHEDIRACTGSGDSLDASKARSRSPLHWNVSRPLPTSVGIYAGVDDGYTGSVPVSHSVEMFNKLAAYIGAADALIDASSAAAIARREVSPIGQQLGSRNVLFERAAPGLSLLVFAGGHEMLPEVAIQQAEEAVRSSAAVRVR